MEEKVPVVSVPEKKEAPAPKGIIFTSMSLQSLFPLGRSILVDLVLIKFFELILF